jgi:sterol desaturase/sphingolipid hydroxylase (fatty acid hydroxylase superfamily)
VKTIRLIIRFGLFPLIFLGGNAFGIALVASGTPLWQRLLVLLGAVGLMLSAERVLPYEPRWNQAHGDRGRDVLHAIVNTTFNNMGIWLLPFFAGLGVFAGVWPATWPFWLQVVFAVLVLDFGVTLAHYFSHRIDLLWRFHAVHHSVERMYGFNGLMKHPVHQTIETIAGMTPLLILGIPRPVAAVVAFAVVLQLLLQHSNVDYRMGPIKYIFAAAEVHRFHHHKGAGQGDVNFGLFTTLWDHLLGTFYYSPQRVEVDALGIGD